MRSTIRNTCFLVLLLATTAWAQQNVLVVPTGASIQTAINTAAGLSGDVLIEVMPGTYPEALDLNGINSPNLRVTLRGVQGQSLTIIDASLMDNHALRGNAVKNFTLDGFTVRNRYNPLKYCEPGQDPSECDYYFWRGLNLPNSTGITVQNCLFDTTMQAMWFPITNPSLSSEVTVVHNTAIGGQGTDPNDPSYTNGQAVNMTYASSETPTGNNKLIVADNVFRTNGSAIRYQTYQPDNNNISRSYTNGTLVMTGNDVRTFIGAGTNIIGGKGHIIAGNRFHDSTAGAQLSGVTGGVIENNLFVHNGPGLIIGEMPIIPSPIPDRDLLVRHNTIVNNYGAGIIYSTQQVGGYVGAPSVYNNIVAFNDASGIVAVGPSSESPESPSAFVPVDLNLARNDVYGNTLKALLTPNDWFSFEGISNPEVATKNYAGVINTSLDLSVDPLFVNAKARDYSLLKNSQIVNKGLTSRSIPSSDFAGTLRDPAPDIGAIEFFNIPK
jgi:hypothetical protein